MRSFLDIDSAASLTVREWLTLKKGTTAQVPLDLTMREAVSALLASWWADTLQAMRQELEAKGIRWRYGQPGITAAEYVRRAAMKP